MSHILINAKKGTKLKRVILSPVDKKMQKYQVLEQEGGL
jgi:hypothetical protein